MANIIATDRAIAYVVIRDGSVTHTGITRPGETTASAELISDVSENELLNALATADVTVPALPAIGEQVDQGIYRFNDTLVLVRQSHTRLATNPLDIAYLSLYATYQAEGDGVLQWVTGEVLVAGVQREYEGTLYQTIQGAGANIFPPDQLLGVIWVVVSATNEWAAGVTYSVNDEVTYQGVTYRCLQAHTSISTWQPPNVPALWQAI